MDKKRAKDIASAPVMMNVNYNGNPIYIEAVNPTKDSASIHFLDQPERSQEVSLTQLEEFT